MVFGTGLSAYSLPAGGILVSRGWNPGVKDDSKCDYSGVLSKADKSDKNGSFSSFLFARE